MSIEVLIVDDKLDIGNLIADVLHDEGFSTRYVESGEAAITAVLNRCPGIILLDIWMGEGRMDGLKALQIIRQTHPHIPVVMMSGHGTVETAVKAMRSGAFDFIEKPFKAEHMILVIQRALDASVLIQENMYLRTQNQESDTLIGTSPFVGNFNGNLEKYAETNTRILFTGPPGSGKDICARLLHKRSTRFRAPYVVFPCDQFAPDEFDMALFGHEPSASQEIQFTTRHVGALEKAHNGILYLKEVDCLPLDIQGKLVKFLHSGSFTRLGGVHPFSADVRIFSGAGCDFQQKITEGLFREDLYHRLNVTSVYVPGLANRREDITPLVNFFLQKLALSYGKRPLKLSSQAYGALNGCAWTGNVRQLRNVIDGLYAQYHSFHGHMIEPSDFPRDLFNQEPPTQEAVGYGGGEILLLPLRKAREAFERNYLLTQVKRFSGNVSQTASFVGMERSALHRKLRSLGLKEIQ
ncbi:MAG: sigma-54-dependent Fis family transcriptional regulator [Alphaproteobacteria bacterium]|nr:MAG: sigma-54-dependent Fis family transcriptional regulator [Alphaproteobacteria bacterium]